MNKPKSIANKVSRDEKQTKSIKFKPLNPRGESPFLSYLLSKFQPKKESWISKISRKFRETVKEKGEFGDHGHIRSGVKEELVTLEECGCDRKLMVETEESWHGGESTCSYSSYRRGGGQRVVGYSYYGQRNSTRGQERKYFQVRDWVEKDKQMLEMLQGIADNLLLLPQHYPGWIMRVYYDLPPGHPVLADLCSLACASPGLDLCHVHNIPSSGDISRVFPMNWRFFPTLDPQVQVYRSKSSI